MTDAKASETWTSDAVIAVIRDLAGKGDLPDYLSEGEITGNDTVDSLGIDSIGGVYLIERLEELTGILMPDDFVELKFTVAELAERLNRLVEEQD